MKLVRYLANLGYGSRREVTEMLRHRRVGRRDGSTLCEGDAFSHDDLLVDGAPLDVAPGVVLMLHKPVGYVCSTRDESRLIYELLPRRFPARSPVIAPVGRLDRDTSGLLVLTDDGGMNHRITSPRARLPKVYEAQLASDLRGDEREVFAGGTLVLHGETSALEPALLEVIAPRLVRLTVTEGRYHQVRRMFTAVGNHVASLHRVAIGGLQLGDLAPGEWRVLSPHDIAALLRSAGHRVP